MSQIRTADRRRTIGSPELKAAIHEYAEKLKAHHVDTVLLSCTHYPFVRKEIEDEFGPSVTVLDPAERTAQDALESPPKTASGPDHRHRPGRSVLHR